MRRMMILLAMPLLVTFAVLLSLGADREKPLARLDIALSKQEYPLGEPLVVTFRITNLSDSLLCFPPPAVECYSTSGELAAGATPPRKALDSGVGGGCAADRWVREDLSLDVDKHWIKLEKLQSYEASEPSRVIQLTVPGRWKVDGGYVPMREDAASQYAEVLKVKGCTLLPELHSEKVTVPVHQS
jgi:hypothetical protein